MKWKVLLIVSFALVVALIVNSQSKKITAVLPGVTGQVGEQATPEATQIIGEIQTEPAPPQEVVNNTETDEESGSIAEKRPTIEPIYEPRLNSEILVQ
jgi:hypothetical protein